MKTHITGPRPEVNAPERQEGAVPTSTFTAQPNDNSVVIEHSDTRSDDRQSSIHATPPTKVSTPSYVDSFQPAPELPNVLKHHDLDRATHTKRVALHVAEALASSPDDAQAKRGASILNCADQVREDKHGNLRPVNRCKHRACPSCQQAKQRVAYARLQSALGYLPPLSDEAHESIPLRKRSQALKLTLNMGQACKLKDLKSRIQELHHLFAVFLRRAPIAIELLGYMRVTEVTQAISPDDAPRANPHLHGFLLVRGDTDLSALAGYILREWPTYILRHHTKRRRKVLTTNSAKSIEPLRSQTKSDLLSWASYMLKGGTYDFTGREDKRLEMHSTTPDFWRGYDEALYRQTLISKGGEIAIALDRAEADYQAQRLIEDRYAHALPSDHGSKVIKPTDFIYLRSIAGYARRSTLEIIHREQLSVSEYLELPNVTGLRCCEDRDLLNEVRSMVLGFTDANSFTLALIALNADRSALKRPSVILFDKYNTRTTNHWSEPTEAHSKRPEDDPTWRPKITPPKEPSTPTPDSPRKL